MEYLQLTEKEIAEQFDYSRAGLSADMFSYLVIVVNRLLHDKQNGFKIKQSVAGKFTSQARRDKAIAELTEYAITHADTIHTDPKVCKLRNIAKALGKHEMTIRNLLTNIAAEHNIVIGDKLREKMPELLQLLIDKG